MVLKLAHLHVFNGLEFDFWNIVLVHIKQDVLYHDDAKLLISPKTVKCFDKFIVRFQQNFFCNRLQKFSCSCLNVVVKHFSVLV